MKLFAIAATAALLACTPSDSVDSDTPSQTVAVSNGTTLSRTRTRAGSIPRGGRDVLADAAAALAEGRPWRATLLLEPIVRDSATRTPAAVLLAARAAAGWEGWRRVERLLGGEPAWLDSLDGGLGRELLARAALDRRADSTAIGHAERAVAVARDDQRRGERLTLAARAHDRVKSWASARDLYLRAASNLPAVADWLVLRAAAVTADDSARRRMYGDVRSAPARARIPWTEAAARERFGDLAGAATTYDSLGARVSATRLRLLDAANRGDTIARTAARSALLGIIESAGGSTAREAVQLLDADSARLTAAQELVVARSAAAGLAERAASGFARAFAAGAGSDRDRFTYGEVLFRLDRYAAAARQFARITGDGPLAASAAYQHARALLRDGRATESRAALRQILTRHARDTNAASAALFLLADLATDEGRDGPARTAYRDVARQYPSSDLAPAARFRAALIAYVDGNFRLAALEFDTLRTRHGSSSESLSATYWSGRSWARLGDTAAARERWRDLAARAPLSYYGMLAARRLGEQPWAPAPGTDSASADSSVAASASRVRQLQAIGLEPEAREEVDALVADGGRSPQRAMIVAPVLRALGQASRAIALANRADEARGAAAYRLRFPVVQEPVLAFEARARGLDIALVAALIRQESSFMPAATSPAGARGLMQLMPSVGRQVAAGLDFPFWDVALLHQADVNVQLGTRHLASLLQSYGGDEALTLAAYNAGRSRVTRWLTKRGTADRELFVERIPYVETRDYVRIILRNKELYRSLYGWPVPGARVSQGAVHVGWR